MIWKTERSMVMAIATVNKFDLYSKGMQTLHKILGAVDTEEFIAYIKSDQFDYTKWQREHFDGKTKEEISKGVRGYVTVHPYKGDPSTVI